MLKIGNLLSLNWRFRRYSLNFSTFFSVQLKCLAFHLVKQWNAMKFFFKFKLKWKCVQETNQWHYQHQFIETKKNHLMKKEEEEENENKPAKAKLTVESVKIFVVEPNLEINHWFDWILNDRHHGYGCNCGRWFLLYTKWIKCYSFFFALDTYKMRHDRMLSYHIYILLY